MDKRFSFSPKYLPPVLVPAQPMVIIRDSLPVAKLPGREAGLSLPSSAEVKTLRNYNSTTGPISVKRSAQTVAYLICLCMALELLFRWHEELLIHTVSSPSAIDQ